MLRIWLLLFIALTIPLSAQSTPAAQVPAHGSSEHAALSMPDIKPGSPSQAAVVGPEDPVITIHGLCAADKEGAGQSNLDQANPDKTKDAASKTTAGSCIAVVTRREFDSVLNAANISGQQVSSTSRENLARGYVTFLAFEQAARKAGFEDAPEFEEIMRWARLRAITDAYRGKIVEDARTATPDEIDAYYTNHLDQFDRIEITRAAIPITNPNNPDDPGFGQNALQQCQSARDRIAHGGDMQQIQKEVYVSLGLPGAMPVDSGSRKRSNFGPEESNELFSLRVGGVSKIETESGFCTVYKITSHQPVELDKARSQIVRAIAEEKVKGAFDSIRNSVQPEYNVKYFGPPEERPVPVH
jgi:hypothetical protein